jgi:hypothetical protein
MARLRPVAGPACPVDLAAVRAALGALDAAGTDADAAAACERARLALGACSAPSGTGCYGHKVARMTVYRWRLSADAAKSAELGRVLGRMPLWPSGAGTASRAGIAQGR